MLDRYRSIFTFTYKGRTLGLMKHHRHVGLYLIYLECLRFCSVAKATFSGHWVFIQLPKAVKHVVTRPISW